MNADAFHTTDGRAVPAVTAAEMREVDRVAVESFGIGVLQMMEHAGRALAGEVLDQLESVGADDGKPAVTVLAGSGGNGGGGLCCARHLANRGVPVAVVLDRAPAALTGPAAHHRETLEAMGVPIGVGPDQLSTGPGHVIVDAVVGYGLDGPLQGTAAELIEALDGAGGPTVSLDVPSGLDATTGDRPGVAVEPDAICTLALPKTGLEGVDARIVLTDIGLPAGVYEQAGVGPVAPFGQAFRLLLREG